MSDARVRIGAVSYLNTRPLVFGLERGMLPADADLSYAPPATLADRLARGALDIGLIPAIELARIPDLEIAPGLGIVCHGATRSVLLVTRRPLDRIRTVALDPESRTSNALARVLFRKVWGGSPEFVVGPRDLDEALGGADAAVRIGDKALFEPVPAGFRAHDLGTAWTGATGLPFVFAVWACRPGALSRPLYRAMHASRRDGARHLDAIADDYTWNGRQHPEVARAYLRENIRFRLGAVELRALSAFLRSAREAGAIDAVPDIRLALRRPTTCDLRAAALHAGEDR